MLSHWGVLMADSDDGCGISLMAGTFIELLPVQNMNKYTVTTNFLPSDSPYSWIIKQVGETWVSDKDLRSTGRITLSSKQR
jgi:hypothetical protein